MQHKVKLGKMLNVLILGAVVLVSWTAEGQANMTIRKLYQSAFEGSSPKCTFCHVSTMPKKEEHELNEYGEKVHERFEAGELTEAVLQELGEAPVDE